MPGLKTNEMPGTRAVLRHYRMSATKARQVLDLIRGQDVDRAEEILRATPREAARVVSKLLASAVANARNNDGLDPEELYVSACYADEGNTLKRWRPRARGRATRIRKRTCHITVIVSRMPDERLDRHRRRQAATAGASRSRRVAASRRSPAPGAVEAPVAGAPGESAGEDVAGGDDVSGGDEEQAVEARDEQAVEAAEADAVAGDETGSEDPAGASEDPAGVSEEPAGSGEDPDGASEEPASTAGEEGD